MNGSSKILTVSYGTFSCTLEGFDDPLGTMRELAEYFRDLAADDRYFGAEPPTPDVEMLQSIAQREVHRKVEARTSPTGVALTQVAEPTETPKAQEAPEQNTTPVEPPEEAQEVSTQSADTGPLTFDDDYLMADEPEDVLAIDPSATTISDGPAESVAEKLRRIRAVVSRRPDADTTTFSAPQAPDAEGKRNRAMTETIRQIQDDISDDQDHAPSQNEGEDDIQPFKVKAEDTPLPKADVAETEETPVDDGFEEDLEASAVASAEPADESDDDGRSMSEFLESVSEKISDPEPAAPAPSANSLSAKNTDADVGRLLEETDNKLNEDGVVRRRQVISQMRAAVAATKADRAVTRLISPEAQEEVEKKAYRNDLSDAVNETQSPPQKSARKPSGPPLVLVSSQRVSDNLTQTDAAISPDKAEAGNDFAKFVEVNGADGLEELLEAAAAFTIFTQGQESFSRPEIMKRVAMIDPAMPMTREDGLRSFGQLLRQGKFQKLDRGQFTIDHETRFNPEKRIAGE